MCIFNHVLSSGYFPDSWTEGIIIPLLKKGDVGDVNNYRGITLMSCLSKISTGVLSKRINKWCDENNVISDCQFGFRKGCSTTDPSFVLHNLIQKTLNNRGRLYCAFVDLKKAFDSIYRNALWYKLFNLGIKGKTFRIIRDMFAKVKSRVKSANTMSDFFEYALGLRQGEVLSPLLFSLFVEDLELHLQDRATCGLSIEEINIVLLLFADDMVIVGNTPENLQNSLNLLFQYCSDLELTVNTQKTKIVVFRKRGQIREGESWTYNNEHIEVVNDVNYLGIVFNYTGTFILNQETLAGKGLKALNVLLANTRKYDFNVKTLCQLFDSFVGSILSYGCEVWGFTKSKELERIHLKFCKLILKVKTSTSNAGIYGELGRYPLYLFRFVRIIRYWCKLMHTNNIVMSAVYKAAVDDILKGLNNWAGNEKSLLEEFGFAHVWLNPHCVNLQTFPNVFKQRLMDCFMQKWHNDLQNNRVLILYKHFKIDFSYESYLNIPNCLI